MIIAVHRQSLSSSRDTELPCREAREQREEERKGRRMNRRGAYNQRKRKKRLLIHERIDGGTP